MRPVRTATMLGTAMMLLAACAAPPDGGVRPAFSLDGTEMSADFSVPIERGKAYFNAGQYGLALEAFREALVRDPDSVRALNDIAATFDQLGRFDLADRYYALALKREPRSVEVLNNLGFSNLLRGNIDEARKYLALASGIASDQPVVQANLLLAEQGGSWARQGPAPAAQSDLGEPGLAGPDLAVRAAPMLAAAPAVPRPEADAGPAQRLLRIAPGVKSLVTRPLAAPVADGGSRSPAAEPEAPAIAAAPRIAIVQEELAPMAIGYQPAAPIETEGWVIEVSNGTGRTAMAARMRTYLGSRGVRVDRLTNDTSFRNATSRIFFRGDAEAAATALKARLPVAVPLERREDQASDLRILLGADLLAFDAGLMRQGPLVMAQAHE